MKNVRLPIFVFAMAFGSAAVAKDTTTCRPGPHRLPIFATSTDPKQVDACIQITEIVGKPSKYKMEYCAKGRFSSACDPLGPNPKGIYTEAELTAAQNRICESRGYCIREAVAKTLASIALPIVTEAGAIAFASGFGGVAVLPLCATQAYVGAGLSKQAIARADDTGKCYDGMKLIQKEKDGSKNAKFAELAKEAAGKAIVLEKSKLGQVAGRLNQLLDPGYRDQPGMNIDPKAPVEYHTPGDGH